MYHKFRRDESTLLLLLYYTGRLCASILHADWRTHIDKCRPMYNNNPQSVWCIFVSFIVPFSPTNWLLKMRFEQYAIFALEISM